MPLNKNKRAPPPSSHRYRDALAVNNRVNNQSQSAAATGIDAEEEKVLTQGRLLDKG